VRLFRRGEQASTLDLLVVGLGNPGREYATTRHNVGFMVADELARRHGGGSWRSKFSGEVADVRVDGARLALLKPQTYMNESGRSVAAAAKFYKVDPESLLAVHDEVDLDLGRMQARLGGGLAGHNGLRSLASALRTPEFLRLRIGVGRPERGDPRPVSDWVLSPFGPDVDVGAIVGRAADAVEALVRHGLDEAQQRFNG
jgi:peptidyl-tRNA hydrolase, PTH1 family